MKNRFNAWTAVLKEAKEEAKRCGTIKGDVDLAETVTEILESEGLRGGTRGWLNHFFTGKREPSVSEFIAICESLKLDPGSVMAGSVHNLQRIPKAADARIAEVVSLMMNTDDLGKEKALTAVKVSLHGHQCDAKQTLKSTA